MSDEPLTHIALDAHREAVDQARRNVAHGWGKGHGAEWALSVALVAIDEAVRADAEQAVGVCIACARDDHVRCSGRVEHPCRCLLPIHGDATRWRDESPAGRRRA